MEWACNSICSLPETRYADQQNGRLVLEDHWVRQAQRGDLEAFNELVLAYQDSVFRQALWMLGDKAAAEDTCQETFLLAFRSIHTFRGGPFRPWIMRIVTNRCIDQIRAARRYPCQPFIAKDEDGEEIEPYWVKDPGESPEKMFERAETGEAILESILKLDPEYRSPVILVDLQEMDYAEASAVLHIPLGTFKSRLSRARQKLRQDLLRGKNRNIGERYVENRPANAKFDRLPGTLGSSMN